MLCPCGTGQREREIERETGRERERKMWRESEIGPRSFVFQPF